jgi:hypothetical protein
MSVQPWTPSELDGIDAADLAVMEIPAGVGDSNPDDDMPIDENGFLADDEPDLLDQIAARGAKVEQVFRDQVAMYPNGTVQEIAALAGSCLSALGIEVRPGSKLIGIAADAKFAKGPFAPAAPEPSSYIVNVEDYIANVPVVIPWVCNPIVYSGGVGMLAGPAKGGKSTLAENLQRCRETGAKLLSAWDVVTGPTLLVTEEGGVAVVYKTEGLHELDILDRRTALGGQLTFAQVLELIGKWSEGHPGGLVFIDTLSIWAGIEDENDDAKVTAALGAVMALAQSTGLAIILVHHTRKGGGEHGEAIRGSGAMLGTVDIGLELTYTGDERYPDERYLTVQGRVILPERYRLSFDRLTKTYSMADMEARAESETDADLAGVPADGPGLTRDDLHNLWGKDPRKLLERYLRAGRLRVEMVKDGRVRALRYWKLPARSLWTEES